MDLMTKVPSKLIGVIQVEIWAKQNPEASTHVYSGIILAETGDHRHGSGSVNYILAISFQSGLSTNNAYMAQKPVLVAYPVLGV